MLADGVGIQSLDFSVAEEAAYVRTGLYSALMNRASGVLLRRWRDLETEKREPYFRDPFEVLVGLNDVTGEPKPVLAEVRKFARVAARLDLRVHTRRRSEPRCSSPPNATSRCRRSRGCTRRARACRRTSPPKRRTCR